MKCLQILLLTLASAPFVEAGELSMVAKTNSLKEAVIAAKAVLAEQEAKTLYSQDRSFNSFWIANAQADPTEVTPQESSCFYGGWPSRLTGPSSHPTCESPRGHLGYEAGKCDQSSFACNPILFGPDVCVPFDTLAQKRTTFARCEQSFQTDKKGSYEFLKMPMDDHKFKTLVATLDAATRLCQKSGGVQSETPMCRKLENKIAVVKKNLPAETLANAVSDAKTETPKETEAATQTKATATTDAATRAPADTETVKKPRVLRDANSRTTAAAARSVSCDTCTAPATVPILNEQIAQTTKDLGSKLPADPDALYETIKQNFLSSDMCDPVKMSGDPTKHASPFFVSNLIRKKLIYFADELMKIPQPAIPAEKYFAKMAQIGAKYNVPPEEINALKPLLVTAQNEADLNREEIRRVGRGEMRANDIAHSKYVDVLQTAVLGLAQKIFTQVTKDPELSRNDINEELIRTHVFSSGPDGKAECPFPAKDAFLRAYRGYQELVRTGKITGKKKFAIGNYTAPSNQRRLFVIDLNEQKVTLNTWLAQGNGDREKIGALGSEGKDGLGDNPPFSTQAGDGLSAQGFLLAHNKPDSDNKSIGARMVLEGLENKNKNVGNRVVEVHKIAAPGTPYLRDIDGELKSSFNPDLVKNASSVADYAAAAKSYFDLMESVSYPEKRMDGTDGCLGVPILDMPKIKKELSEGLIFSYSGPDQAPPDFVSTKKKPKR